MPILIIANPKSGRYDPKKLETVKDILTKRFGDVSVTLTEYPGHATEIARLATQNVIIAAGGDGLINEVAQGVTGTDKLFSALCFGSVNVFCREYGIGLNPIKSAKKLKIDKFVTIPAGYVDSKIFLTMAGFGFDAQIVKNVNKWRITNIYILSELLHIIHGCIVLLKHQFPRFNIFINGSKKTTYHAIVSIGARYAGDFRLGHVKKGKLNLFSIHKEGSAPLIKTIFSIFLGFGFKGNKECIDCLKIAGVSFCQIDGQFIEFERDNVFVRVKPDAIKLVS